MKKRESINLALHITLAGALTALVMWHVLFINLAVFIYAWLREQAQHLYDWDVDGSGRIIKTTTGFFGWMTWHRMWEVFQWVIGSAVVSIPWYFFG